MTTDTGLEGFEPFDPTQEPSEREAEAVDEFEDFDVTAEPEATSDEFGIESLGDLSDSEDELRSVLAARDEAERALMSSGADAVSAMNEDGSAGLGNVVGVGIAEKMSAGGPTGQLAVTVFVKEKVSSRSVSAEALVPQSIGGVPTDVEQVGDIDAQMFRFRRRPAPGGISIGNVGQPSAGTLGCLVRRGAQLFILSNNHVMALSNAAPLNSAIVQPGRLDVGGAIVPADIIARLHQFVPINFNPAAFNFVDAAIARTAPALVDRRIMRSPAVLQPLGPGIVQPVLNLPVMKSGRTTQFRRGVVDAVNVTISVNYGAAGVARFARQFRVRGVVQPPFSAPGDSGSLVTSQAGNRPVGLLFAGNTQTNTTFCNPIGAVLSSLNVQIVI